MKTFQYLKGIIVLATFMFVSCSHENGTITDRIDNNTAPLCLNVVKNGFTDKGQTRTNTDENYVTSFTDGESVGIFAVKGGVILSDCNNLKLTYNSSAGTWTGNNVYYYSGAQYYAYAPYNDNMAGKTIDQIKTDYPYSADQSTSAKFIENDLLVSSSCTADPVNETLQISFVHARALLVFENVTIAHYLCTSSGNGDFVYALNNTALTKITLGGTDNTAGIGANGTLLYIVKPGASPEIIEDYTLGVANALSYTAIEGATSATANTYQKLTLTKNRDLEIGDFFYKDGSFYPGSTTEAAPNQDNCVGVVAYLYKAGDTKNYVTDSNWEYGSTYKTGMIAAKYEDTEKISNSNRATKVAEFVATLPAFTRENTQVSGWHLPKAGELAYLCTGDFHGNYDAYFSGTTLKDKLNPYIEKAGGIPFKNAWYFTNQSYGSNTSRGINFANGNLSIDSTSELYRITLAF